MWVGAAAAVGEPARPAPLSGPRVSAPLLSGYLAVAFRRGGLKTPGGSPFRPQGRGSGGARRDVGRSGGASRVLRDRLSLRLGGPSVRRRFPRRRRSGVVSRAPSGRPWGPLRAPGAPALPRAAAGAGSAGVPCRVCPAFPFPTLFSSHVSRSVSRWPARGERPRSGGVVPSSATREFAHTRDTDTTLSGGSLGSCVDEERS